jgi:RimJ/RimL family protein N-acetyltransferase
VPTVAAACVDNYIPLIDRLPQPFSEEAAADWIAGRRGILERGEGIELAIVDRAAGAAVGSAGLKRRHPPGSAETGYWVVPARRRAGFATAATRLISRWALTADVGIHRVQAVVHVWNTASQRVLEKAGFQREGVLRDYTTYNGRREDVYLYSLLRRDLD